jgi:glutathione S-transferase
MQGVTKIWARRSSSAAQKVFWALAELQVPHEQINAGAAYGIVDQPEYQRKNPNGVVPTLEEDDGFVLWESNAVVRYLADLHGQGSLQPADAQQRARSDSWMDWTTTTLEPPISGLWTRLVLKWERPELVASNEALIARAEKALRILSERLSREDYLLGPTLTMGDLPLGVLVNRWFKLPIEHPELPRIRRYYELLCKRAAYRDQVVATRPLI